MTVAKSGASSGSAKDRACNNRRGRLRVRCHDHLAVSGHACRCNETQSTCHTIIISYDRQLLRIARFWQHDHFHGTQAKCRIRQRRAAATEEKGTMLVQAPYPRVLRLPCAATSCFADAWDRAPPRVAVPCSRATCVMREAQRRCTRSAKNSSTVRSVLRVSPGCRGEVLQLEAVHSVCKGTGSSQAPCVFSRDRLRRRGKATWMTARVSYPLR